MKKQKLTIFLPNLDGGGAERTMLNLAKGISERGYPVDLVLAQANGPYINDIPDHVNIVDLGNGNIHSRGKTIRRLPALIRYLRSEKPDVMLSALVEANVVGLVAKFFARVSTRVVVNEQNNLSTMTNNASSRSERWYPVIAQFVYRSADYVVGVSQGVVEDLIHNIGISEKKARVVFNPGITKELRLKAAQSLDHPWFEANQPPVILSVGRLNVQKDYGTLIDAFYEVSKKRTARLLILGDGEERSMLEEKIKHYGLADKVSLPGFVDNPYAYMSKADVYVLSSRWEGLPTVLVEALYCGPTIVSTDCPSGPVEILENGQQGTLIPMQDVSSMASAIELAIDGKSPKADPESWRRFELEGIVDNYINLLFSENP